MSTPEHSDASAVEAVLSQYRNARHRGEADPDETRQNHSAAPAPFRGESPVRPSDVPSAVWAVLSQYSGAADAHEDGDFGGDICDDFADR